MTDKLLPPDPSRDGWYWIDFDGQGMAPFLFTAYDQEWCRLSSGAKTRPEEAANWKWTLANRHPIPGPAELDALHALPDAMVKAEREASEDAPNDFKIIGIGAAKNAAKMLRDVLGIQS